MTHDADGGADFPRVLIVSPDSISSPDAVGLTLASLFAGWPADRLANIYYNGEAPPGSTCGQAWRMRPSTLPMRAAAKIARELLGPARDSVIFGADRLVHDRSWRARLAETFRAIAQLATPGLTDGERRGVERFKPDVVYSLVWGFTGLKITEEASRLSGAPVVPHFLDDWPAVIFRSALFGLVLRMVLQRRLHRILGRAPLGIAIGDEMAEEFRLRYDLPFTPFMRCVECGRSGARMPPEKGAPLRLLYTGLLPLERANVLAGVATAMELLAAGGTECSLTVHSPRDRELEIYRSVLGSFRRVQWGGALSDSRVNEALLGADIAVHVASFEPCVAAFSRLSLSTKLPSYVAAGLPILAVGPADASSIRYVERLGIGLSVPQPDPALIAASLERLAEQVLWSECSSRANQVCRERHSAGLVRRRFAATLTTARNRPLGQGMTHRLPEGSA